MRKLQKNADPVMMVVLAKNKDHHAIYLVFVLFVEA